MEKQLAALTGGFFVTQRSVRHSLHSALLYINEPFVAMNYSKLTIGCHAVDMFAE